MNKINNDINKNPYLNSNPLFFNESEEEYLKGIEESNESFKRLQEKYNTHKQNINNEDENDEDKEDEDSEDDSYDDSDIDLDEEEKSGLVNFAKNILKKVGMKSLIATGATFGSIGLGSVLLITMYRIHYDGEFEFKGISGEYQTTSFKKMNFTSFNANGDVQLGGLTKENKLTKAYYTLYSDNSYYAVVEDSKKYKNIDDAYKRENLLTPEELREQYPDIKDTEGREKMFQLNPDVIYSMDRYLHKNKFLYPQQFIKPVYYEESKENFKLKDLVVDDKVVAKSQKFNADGTPVKNDDGSLKKESGIWDYGLASILQYKEYEVKERTITNLSGSKVVYKGLSGDSPNDSVSTDKNLPQAGTEVRNTLNNVNIPTEHPNKSSGTSTETVRDTPAYAIERAVTAGGTILSKVSQKWQEKAGSRKTETLTYIIHDIEEYEVISDEDLDGDGEMDVVKKYRTHVYEASYTYEIYTEEYVPYYEGDLDTSEIVGSKYYRQYIRNYSNYIPTNVPKEIDYSVLNNEEVSEIFTDDDANAYSSSANLESNSSSSSSSESNLSSNSEPDSNSESGSESNSSSSLNSNSSSSLNSNSNLVGLNLPAPREGEERSVSDVLSIGSKKDTQPVLNSLKYLSYFQKYGEMYGVDPYILAGMASGESGGNPNANNGSALGIMQIEKTVTKVKAYNHKTKQIEEVIVNRSRLTDPDYCIKIGAMELAQRLADMHYNILMSIQGYNYGLGGIKSAVQYYLSGGTIGVNHTVDTAQFTAYAESNHVGWITALYPGDLPKENSYSELNGNDGKHSARTWYSNTGYKKYGQGAGTPVYIERVLQYYAGTSSPWVMKPDGTVVTVDGSSSTGYVGGSSSAISAFNSYLASNWQTILDNKEKLYPWSVKLDELLNKDKKANYENKNIGELVPRDTSLFVSNLTSTDEDIILSMMFALNQGNYLSKYDYMGEAEWKAMYNQLLSSPTGKTWDDKWIGFTCEEVFGKSLEDLGKLFKDGSGVNPTISRRFGKLKNMYTDDNTEALPQYNETNFGIDLSIPEDTEVLALEDGEIIAISKSNDILGRYGNFVQIKFNSNTKMLIANLKSINKGIKVGKKVSKGDVIGVTGGDCKSYKEGDLHIELLYKDGFINPEWIITRDMTGFDDPISGNNGVYCGGDATSNVSNSAVVNNAITIAKQKIGKPYVWGATGPDSFDCSGFMYYILKESGVQGERKTAKGYYEASTEVSRDQIQPGDFVFWHDLAGNKHSSVYHIGLYIGNDEVIDCSPDHSGVGLRNLSSLQDSSKKRFTFGRYSSFVGSTVSTGSASASGCVTSSDLLNADESNFIWPVPSASRVSSTYGNRIHPVTGKSSFHQGIDIPASKGEDIVASKGGTVSFSGVNGSYGNLVIIDHGDGTSTRYAHNSVNTVSKGDKVTQGQVIAKIGSTGRSTGPHLHFEVRVGNDHKNPLDYVKKP